MALIQDRPLDLRTFQDIVDEARRLIPKYCPEWTDHNLSDPGITLVELFAWMTEMILYQVNRVPDEMYERFLDLVGIRRHPPTPAIADVTFYLSAPLPRPITIPAETEVATDRTETEEAIVFATTAPLTIEPPTLIAVRAWRQGQGSEDYLPYVTSGLIEAPIFNEPPEEGDALYIGYAGDLSGYGLELRLECEDLEGSHIDPAEPSSTVGILVRRSERLDGCLSVGSDRQRPPQRPDGDRSHAWTEQIRRGLSPHRLGCPTVHSGRCGGDLGPPALR